MATETSASPLAKLTSDDPRVRAAARAQALQEHWHGISPDASDKFWIDPGIIPDGWTYMWRVYTVLGKPDESATLRLQQHGWEPVPLKRHPELMPAGYQGNTIEREGMRLMELPTVIYQARRDEELRLARQQIGDKEAELAGHRQGTFERTAPKINRSYEAMPIPK